MKKIACLVALSLISAPCFAAGEYCEPVQRTILRNINTNRQSVGVPALKAVVVLNTYMDRLFELWLKSPGHKRK